MVGEFDEESNITSSENLSKIQQLEAIAASAARSSDATTLKSQLATFLLSHASKVMDTVAPLETLRDELSTTFIEKAQDMLEDPEITPGQLYKAIDAIQAMNTYSLGVIKNILDAEKLSTIVAIDASDNSITNVNSNVLNLEGATSRAKVAKAIAAINRIMSESSDTGGESNDN